MVIFFYGFCRMDKVYTYSVHWGGIVHIQERVNCPQWMGNLPILQIYPILQNSSMLQNSSTLQFTHVEGRIAIRPYTCVIRTLANIHINHVNTQKRRHGHGMRAFACVVGAKSASWRSGVCEQFAHTTIRPHRKFTHVANSSTS